MSYAFTSAFTHTLRVNILYMSTSNFLNFAQFPNICELLCDLYFRPLLQEQGPARKVRETD